MDFLYEMDSGFKDSCTGAFHAQARWERIVLTSEQFLWKVSHWFHGPAHNPYQRTSYTGGSWIKVTKCLESNANERRLQEKYCIDWVVHSLRDLFSECECSELPLETPTQEDWDWPEMWTLQLDMNHCKTLQLKQNQNILLQCYSFSRLIPSLPRAGGHHTPVQEVDQSTSASSRHQNNIHV